MCDVRKRLSRDVGEALMDEERALRIESGNRIALQMLKVVLKRWEQCEKEWIDVLKGVAERRGDSQTGINFTQARKGEMEVLEKDLRDGDLVTAVLDASTYMDQNELAVLDSIFQNAEADLQTIFEGFMIEAYSDGLNVAFGDLERFARPQDPTRFGQVDPNYQINRQSAIVQNFIRNGLDRVRAKVSVNHKAQLLQIITEELGKGTAWNAIVSKINKTVGSGAHWHWKRLVRTELQFAYMTSAKERYEDAGVQYVRVSIARTACPICVRGKGVFRMGEYGILPRHPNCRCTLIPMYRTGRSDTVNPLYTEPTKDWINEAHRLIRAGDKDKVDFTL